jgi:transcriptional regulator with XRE-family HTH domain
VFSLDDKFAELALLVKKAIGNRSQNQFALKSGVNSGHLSRILNGKINNPPEPDTLKKIAANSQGNVTYQELMIASGHIDASIKVVENKSNEEVIYDILKDKGLDDKDIKVVQSVIDSLTKEEE